ncbi:hypothetical protein OIV19_18205 [Brucella sp. HL-2]|nr:hypothetical protein [Brucella sp. HL-2]MCV9909536.1 hypothetical protein [Brucella sp. HL-2]
MRSNSLPVIENKAINYQYYAAENVRSAIKGKSSDVREFYQERASLYAREARKYLFMLIDEMK